MKSRTLGIVCVLAAAIGCGHKEESAKSTETSPASTTTTESAAQESPQSPDGPASIAVPDLVISSAAADVEKGKTLFLTKGCSACHKIGGGKLVGPDLKGVTARRHTKWIERMIEKPEVMLQQDDVAKGLFKTHFTAMANQNVNPETELPALLAYLKSNE